MSEHIERVLSVLAALAVNRAAGADYVLYTGLKRTFERECPDATPAEYEHAVREIARYCGV